MMSTCSHCQKNGIRGDSVRSYREAMLCFDCAVKTNATTHVGTQIGKYVDGLRNGQESRQSIVTE